MESFYSSLNYDNRFTAVSAAVATVPVCGREQWRFAASLQQLGPLRRRSCQRRQHRNAERARHFSTLQNRLLSIFLSESSSSIEYVHVVSLSELFFCFGGARAHGVKRRGEFVSSLHITKYKRETRVTPSSLHHSKKVLLLLVGDRVAAIQC